jgi:two-component system sensor histidine kinase DctS
MEPVVARMARLAGRAGSIIQHVNAFARRREISRRRLDLVAVLRRVPLGIVQGRPLSLVRPHGPVWIEADELLLEHLINNLVGNALDWAHQGGRAAQVRIEVDRDPSQRMAVLVVADSGPGVREEDNAHIFNAFVSTKEDGMGMGLAICRSIVEAHHGRIEVGRDETLGGARFTVWLALADDASAAPAPPLLPAPTEPEERHAPRRHSHR